MCYVGSIVDDVDFVDNVDCVDVRVVVVGVDVGCSDVVSGCVGVVITVVDVGG